MRYSYSRLSKYNQCPKAFYYQYVEQSIPYSSSPDAAYGSEMHDFIDCYMKGTAEITPRTEFLRPLLTKLKSIKGRVETEYGLGFMQDKTPTTFDDKSAFVIGKSDCTIFHPTEPKLKIFDWKFTGKITPESYKVEMDMFRMLHFWMHPEIEHIETGLVWLKTPAPTTVNHCTRDDLPMLESTIMSNIERVEESISFEKFPCKVSGLCYGWCGATMCQNWKPKKEKR